MRETGHGSQEVSTKVRVAASETRVTAPKYEVSATWRMVLRKKRRQARQGTTFPDLAFEGQVDSILPLFLRLAATVPPRRPPLTVQESTDPPCTLPHPAIHRYSKAEAHSPQGCRIHYKSWPMCLGTFSRKAIDSSTVAQSVCSTSLSTVMSRRRPTSHPPNTAAHFMGRVSLSSSLKHCQTSARHRGTQALLSKRLRRTHGRKGFAGEASLARPYRFDNFCTPVPLP